MSSVVSAGSSQQAASCMHVTDECSIVLMCVISISIHIHVCCLITQKELLTAEVLCFRMSKTWLALLEGRGAWGMHRQGSRPGGKAQVWPEE
jgi:hypothetical protein